MFCLGKDCEPMWKAWNNANRPVEWKMTRPELIEALRKEVRAGDVVLL